MKARLNSSELRCQPGNDRFLPDRRQIAGQNVDDAWIEIGIKEPKLSRARWVCALRITHDPEGEPVIGELRIFPNGPDPARRDPWRPMPGRWSADRKGHCAVAPRGGITARLLRHFRLGDPAKFLATIQRALGNLEEADAREPRQRPQAGKPPTVLQEPINQWLLRSLEGPPAKSTVASGKRRARVSDFECAELANAYVALVAGGDRKPKLTLGRQRRMDRGTVNNRIHQARQRGILSEVRHGYRGGKMTPKGLSILASGSATSRLN